MDATLESLVDILTAWKVRALQAERTLQLPTIQEAIRKHNEKLSEGNDPEERGVQQDGSDAVAGDVERPDSDEPEGSG